MTQEQFEKYADLKEQLDNIESNLKYLNSTYNNQLIVDHESSRLLLSYGNGMWNKEVCSDNEIVKEVYDLLIMRLNGKKVEIKRQMKEL